MRFAFTALPLLLLSCAAGSPGGAERLAPPREEFVRYWQAGKAEITRYELRQARYGEMREGSAVMIFVTEDVLADRQVKLESEPAGRTIVPVLKLNMTKSFTTGIYPYSMMTSVFSPVDQVAPPHPLKVTTSVQEWCGQTWMQINRRNGRYELEERSYFEREGDRRTTLDTALLEDEVWTRVRMNWRTLPTGRFLAVPATMSARLRHVRPAPEEAVGTITMAPQLPFEERVEEGHAARGRAMVGYTIDYPSQGRTLTVYFTEAFPHEIMAWSETYRDGREENAPLLTTTGVRRETMMIDYWRHNAEADSVLRRQLGF